MKLLIQAIGFGIASGAVISLGAVGFTVQFGISNVLNVSYGALLTLAAFVGYALLQIGISIWLALALTSIATGIISVLFNRVLIEPLMRRHGLRRGSVDDATGSARSRADGIVRATVASGTQPTLF